MKVLRFTGAIDVVSVDVRLTTDMINNDDYFFNIVQIQTGEEFNVNDKNESDFLKYFSETFKETNSNIVIAKQFAIDNGLDLRLYSGDGTYVFLINDISTSEA